MQKHTKIASNFALYPAPFGSVRIAYKGLYITVIENICKESPLYKEETSDKGSPCEVSDTAFEQLSEYFEGKRRSFDFPTMVEGTVFQKKVWKALCSVAYGQTRSYKEIAAAIGNPKACRAVGGANNKNPLSIVVPCHRIIGANGSLTGYASGLDIKRYLLEFEKENCRKDTLFAF